MVKLFPIFFGGGGGGAVGGGGGSELRHSNNVNSLYVGNSEDLYTAAPRVQCAFTFPSTAFIFSDFVFVLTQ